MNVARHTLANALRVAAKQFESDAHDCSCRPGHDRIAAQFEQQAKEARGLADDIENADKITLMD